MISRAMTRAMAKTPLTVPNVLQARFSAVLGEAELCIRVEVQNLAFLGEPARYRGAIPKIVPMGG